MKSKEIMVHNLPYNRAIIADVDAKPFPLLFSSMLLGGFLIALSLTAYGIALIALSVMTLAFLPNVVLIEFSEDYLVIYNKVDKRNCTMVYYDEIVFWTYNRGIREDELSIELSDGSVEKINCFSKKKISRIMEIQAPGKEKIVRETGRH